MRLMIVDDNARVRRMIVEVAAPTGDVIECADGSQALPAYLRHRPDVVLMDISLGSGLDGIEAAAQIVAADPHARVVMVTDYDGEELREAAQAAGACGYVLKEDLFELRGLLERLVARPS
jgi:two-component system, chemotaxis family, chemotaxis protein CheY